MESDIAGLMKKPFPIVVALGISAQLALTIFMIWYGQGTLHPPAMDATEPAIVFKNLLIKHSAPMTSMIPRRSTTNLEEGANDSQQQLIPSSSASQDYELRRRESGRPGRVRN